MLHKEKEPWNLVIGQITAPFGVVGALRVRPETDAPERFSELRTVYIELPSGEARLWTVRRARANPKGIILELAECQNRDDAESLRGGWIKIQESMAIPLAENAYWIHEIIGLRVVNDRGEDLGQVLEVIQTPANDVYVTERVMVPAVRGVVRQVDLANERILVSSDVELQPAKGARR